MSHRTNRRDFIRNSALAGVGVWVAGRTAFGADEDSKSPNEKINFASIGIGGKGAGDSTQASKFGNMVAICDIDDKRLTEKGNEFPKAKKFNDFRKMLDQMGKEIDAVTVSTADHCHAVASMMAIKMGKHVYCQKPMTHNVAEARALREAANEHKVATQMGNQGSANSTMRAGIEAIQAGAIGSVKEVHVWTNRPIWPQAPAIMKRPDPEPIPANIHWEEWLGPAPERPYSSKYVPFNWRGWWDFGTGALGDMGCHTCNLPFRALKLGYPNSVQGECGDLNPETYPSWATVHFEFPARGDMPPLKLTWWEGHKPGEEEGKRVINQPPKELFQGEKIQNSGSLIIGDKGTLYSPSDYGEKWTLLRKDDFKDFKAPEPTLPRHEDGRDDDNMKREWAAAIKGGPPASSNFNIAGMLTEFILLGNIAIRAEGKKLEWDGPGMKFANDPAANKWLKSPYRHGWTL